MVAVLLLTLTFGCFTPHADKSLFDAARGLPEFPNGWTICLVSDARPFLINGPHLGVHDYPLAVTNFSLKRTWLKWPQPESLRHTLAHELGHIIGRTQDECEAERLAHEYLAGHKML